MRREGKGSGPRQPGSNRVLSSDTGDFAGVLYSGARSGDSDMDAAIQPKLEQVRAQLRALGSALVAVSGGVDSVRLAKIAVDVLGADRVLAVTGRSPSVPRAE